MWIESNKTKKFGILTHLLFKHKEKPDSYTWHHLDDYNVETNTCTLELVLSKAHDEGRPMQELVHNIMRFLVKSLDKSTYV